jgi:hypothetical protein
MIEFDTTASIIDLVDKRSNNLDIDADRIFPFSSSVVSCLGVALASIFHTARQGNIQN